MSWRFRQPLEALGVSVTDWVAMRALSDRGEVGHAQLIQALGMTKGATSKLVSRLEARSRVGRRPAAGSTRDQALVLAPSGHALAPRLAAVADANDAHVFGHLDTAQRQALPAALQALARHHQIPDIPMDRPAPVHASHTSPPTLQPMQAHIQAWIVATIQAWTQGQIQVGAVIAWLVAAGAGSHHVDDRSGRTTCHRHDVNMLDLRVERPSTPLADTFDGEAVRAAIRGAQQGRVRHPEFKQRRGRAGCMGDRAWITGRHVVSLGRRSETHVERVPD